MAQDIKLTITLDGAGNLKKVSDGAKKVSQNTDKASKSTEKYNKTQKDAYTRQKQGVIQTANTTKNFSKLQQATDGGGAGGLVRAYALLAANVFALTAAFGVLSRASQVDTLIESMEILSTTGGTYIKNLSKELQEASGFAVDLAQSFRQVSLASSAGLSTKEIEGLTQVAKGAAISLGRNLPDAMDRIFRGAIKLEPEILDEIGLFVRVDEAAQKYARNNGKVVSALTQVERRQAFLNEILEQGQRKFQQYAEEIKPDPYVRLGAALGDIAQGGLTVVNSMLGPLLGFLAESKILLQAVFGALVFVLLKKAVPALGIMTKNTAELAQERAEAAKEYTDSLRHGTNRALSEEEQRLKATRKTLKQQQQDQKRFVSRSSQPGASTTALDKAKLGTKKRAEKVQERINVLEKAQAKAKGKNLSLIKQELAFLKDEVKLEERLKQIENEKRKGIKPGTLADRRQNKLDSQARVSGAVADIAGTMETQGVREGFGQMTEIFKEQETVKGKLVDKYSLSEKALIGLKGGVSATGIAFNNLMMKLGPIMMIFTLLSPILIAIGKAMGFGRKETKAFSEAIERQNDLLENASERFKTQTDIIHENKLSYLEVTKAQVAFNKSSMEIGESLLSIEEKFQDVSRTANAFTNTGDFLKGLFTLSGRYDSFFASTADRNKAIQEGTKKLIEGAAREGSEILTNLYSDSISGADKYIEAVQKVQGFEQQQVKSRKLLKESFEDNNKGYRDTSAVLNELEASLRNNGKLTNAQKETYLTLDVNARRFISAVRDEFEAQTLADKIRKNLNIDTQKGLILAEEDIRITQKNAKAYEVLVSAITGAQESVGKFQQTFMPKTKVDDILSSFDQMSAGFQTILDDDELDNTKVEEFFKKFADSDNAFGQLFNTLFTEVDGVMTLIDKSGDAAKTAFKEAAEELREYQGLIITSKAEIARLTSLEKRYQKLTRGGLGVNTKRQQAITDIAKENLKVQEATTNVSLISFGTKKEELATLRKLLDGEKDQLKRAEIMQGFGISANEFSQAQAFFDEEEIKRIEKKVAVKTEESRIEKEGLEALKVKIAAQKELSDASQKALDAELKANAIRTRGTASLNPAEAARVELEAANRKFEFVVLEAQIKKSLLAVEEAILLARIDVLKEEGKLKGIDVKDLKKNVTDATGLQQKALKTIIKSAKDVLLVDLEGSVSKAFGTGLVNGILAQREAIQEGIAALDKKDVDGNAMGTKEDKEKLAKGLQLAGVRDTITTMSEELKKLGPEGELVALVAQGAMVISDAWGNVGEVFARTGDKAANSMERGAAVAAAVASTLTAIGQIMQQNSQVQISEMDKQIQSEKNRDGKSKESLGKIKAMEAKKEAMKRKAFDQNKKMQMAVTVANTAAGIMGVWSGVKDPFFSPGIAAAQTAVIAALGAAQLAVIAKTSYSGGASSVDKPQVQKVSMGKRDNKVDVSRGGSAGELAYLRGQRGYGSGANNFTPTGGAYGKKGYFTGGEGILVGEQGPEVIKPTSPKVDVIPNNELNKGQQNINFNINAVDASGVQELLVEQRGNIIEMIREAANDTGEYFLEQVDTQSMGGSGSGY